jgi:hypothetical protein
MNHHHLIEKPHPPYLCECGARWSVEREKWIEPKAPREEA